MSTDAQLLRRYVEEKSEAAFAELVRQHVNLVYFAALRQVGGNTHRAEDIAQTVFTDLARKAASLCNRATLAGWLHTSTRYAAAKVRRADAIRHVREQEAQTMREALHDSGENIEWERLRPLIDDAVHELGERDREAVLLRFLEGRAFGEIGLMLGVSEDGARMRVDRALGKLRVVLARRGVVSTSAALGIAFAQQAAASAPAALAATTTGTALSAAAMAELGASATVVTFMTGTKTLVGLGLMVAAALGIAAYQSRQSHTAAERFSIATQENTALTAQLAALNQRIHAAEKVNSESVPAVAPKSATPPSPAAFPTAAEAASRARALQQYLNTAPELVGLRYEKERLSWLSIMGPLFRGLGLNENQLEQASEWVAAGRMRQLAREKQKQNSPSGEDGFSRKMRADFGDAVADGMDEMDKFGGPSEWRMVESLSSRFYYIDSPVSMEQAKQLVQAFNRAKTTLRAENTGWNDYDWERVVTQAGTFLTAPQLQVLRAMAAQRRGAAQIAAAQGAGILPK